MFKEQEVFYLPNLYIPEPAVLHGIMDVPNGIDVKIWGSDGRPEKVTEITNE